MTLLYFVLAAAALGILVFIHELAHYFAARWMGMQVEIFSIGFGRPLFKWKVNNVDWQLGWLPFGGYVKIKGMELSKKDSASLDPYEIPDGFFSKAPWRRIVVALAGPFSNFVLAFLLFLSLYLMGGREKPFSEFTKIVGWVDPSSQLYYQGLRPGDEISTVNGKPFTGWKDFLYATMLGDKRVKIEGSHIDYETGDKVPFSYAIDSYQSPNSAQGILTTGVLAGARYLIYDKFPNGEEAPLPDGSPMATSGIQYGDRVIWADGMYLFSLEELNHIVNDNKALLTVKRGNNYFLSRQPRIVASDLSLPGHLKNELIDWSYEAGIKGRWQALRMIPYKLNAQAVVEGDLKFIDDEAKAMVQTSYLSEKLEAPLQKGDQIVAIAGIEIQTAYQLLDLLQARHVQLIVERGNQKSLPLSWQNEDEVFTHSLDTRSIEEIADSIGTPRAILTKNNFVLLRPVEPKRAEDFASNLEGKEKIREEFAEQRQKINSLKNDQDKARALRLWESNQGRVLLGVHFQDQTVNYNPGPLTLFGNVFKETWQTLKALVTGSLSPKWLSGPVGIVQVIHHGWSVGIGEALFWIGAISMNLAVLNLLPLPVLDGGHVVLALWEAITKKRLKAKTMERLIIPFVVLLVGLLIFLTFQDIFRLF